MLTSIFHQTFWRQHLRLEPNRTALDRKGSYFSMNVRKYHLFKKRDCQRKSMQEKESIMVVWCELKIPSLGITVQHHSASLVMPNSYPRDRIVNSHLTIIKGSYILEQSDLGLLRLPFHLHHFDSLRYVKTTLSKFQDNYSNFSGVCIFKDRYCSFSLVFSTIFFNFWRLGITYVKIIPEQLTTISWYISPFPLTFQNENNKCSISGE